MPFSLTIASQEDVSGSATAKLTFDGTQRVVLGRGPGCDVRIPDVTVSHRHASLRSDAGRVVLVDEGSTNGTYVNGKRLDPRTPYAVKVGSTFRVGAVSIAISEAEGPATRDVALATRELAMQMVMAALAKRGDTSSPVVRVVEGPDTGSVLSLVEYDRPYSVGRDDKADLPLSDKDVSRESVALTRFKTSVMVRHHGGKNAVFVGEAPLRPLEDAPWRASVPLRIGGTWLMLEEPILDALLGIESAKDEEFALPLASSPPPPVVPSSPPARSPQMGGGGTPAPGAALVERANVTPRGKGVRKDAVPGVERALAAFAVLVLLVSVALTVWIIRG